MRAPVVSPILKLILGALAFLMACALLLSLGAAQANAEGCHDGTVAAAMAEGAGESAAPVLASSLARDELRVSVDVALAAEGDDVEPVVGSFTVDGLTYAVTGAGEAALVAVSPRTLADSLVGDATGDSAGVPSGEDSGSGVPPRSEAEQVPSGATSPSPSPEGASCDGAEGEASASCVAAGEPIALAIPASVEHDGVAYAVTSVGPRALAGCAAATVAIPATVETVDESAFQGSAVASVEVAPGNPAYSSYDGMLFDADQLSLLLIPEGKQGAARIPKTAEVVPPSAFSHCAGVTAIDVEAGSAAFSSRNGCLYDVTGETLVRVPAGVADIVVADGCAVVAAGSMEGCGLLERIESPASVREVVPRAFGQSLPSSALSVAMPAGSSTELWERLGAVAAESGDWGRAQDASNLLPESEAQLGAFEAQGDEGALRLYINGGSWIGLDSHTGAFENGGWLEIPPYWWLNSASCFPRGTVAAKSRDNYVTVWNSVGPQSGTFLAWWSSNPDSSGARVYPGQSFEEGVWYAHWRYPEVYWSPGEGCWGADGTSSEVKAENRGVDTLATGPADGLLPWKRGHRFVGWTTTAQSELLSQIMVPAEVRTTYTACFEPFTYSVKLHYYADGANGRELRTQTLFGRYGQAVTLPVKDCTGYKFERWCYDPEGTKTASEPGAFHVYPETDGAVVMLYGQARPIHYTLKLYYFSDGGAIACDIFDRTYDDAEPLPAMESVGYTFREWSTEKGGAGMAYGAGSTANLTTQDGTVVELFQQQDPNRYEVVLHYASGEDEVIERVYDQPSTLPETDEPGYRFLGWATEVDGGGVLYPAGVVGNLASEAGARVDLYEQREAIVFTVIFDTSSEPAGGSVPGDALDSLQLTVADGVAILERPRRAGYIFLEWIAKDHPDHRFEHFDGTVGSQLLDPKDLVSLSDAQHVLRLTARWTAALDVSSPLSATFLYRMGESGDRVAYSMKGLSIRNESSVDVRLVGLRSEAGDAAWEVLVPLGDGAVDENAKLISMMPSDDPMMGGEEMATRPFEGSWDGAPGKVDFSLSDLLVEDDFMRAGAEQYLVPAKGSLRIGLKLNLAMAGLSVNFDAFDSSHGSDSAVTGAGGTIGRPKRLASVSFAFGVDG